MSSYFKAYKERIIRNQHDLLTLAKKVIKKDPDIEVYCHHNFFNQKNSRYISSLTFFKKEDLTTIAFHQVPYRWSGCGHGEFRNSHYGINNNEMPFIVDDVLSNLTPVTKKKKRNPNVFFISKKEYLQWYSYLTRLHFKNNDQLYYHGKVLSEITLDNKQGDHIVTEKGDVFRFVYGSQNTSKEPYLEFIQNTKVPKFLIDDNIRTAGKKWQPLGDAAIYKTSFGEYIWKY